VRWTSCARSDSVRRSFPAQFPAQPQGTSSKARVSGHEQSVGLRTGKLAPTERCCRQPCRVGELRSGRGPQGAPVAAQGTRGVTTTAPKRKTRGTKHIARSTWHKAQSTHVAGGMAGWWPGGLALCWRVVKAGHSLAIAQPVGAARAAQNNLSWMQRDIDRRTARWLASGPQGIRGGFLRAARNLARRVLSFGGRREDAAKWLDIEGQRPR
jgi:hypothetical protein